MLFAPVCIFSGDCPKTNVPNRKNDSMNVVMLFMPTNLRKKRTGDIFSNKYYPQLTRFQGEEIEGFTANAALNCKQNIGREFYGSR